MKEILVTGVNGFVGYYLATELSNQGHRVIGTDRAQESSPKLTPFIDGYFGNCDLTDAEAVAGLPLDKVDSVINLAGLAQVGTSFDRDQAERYRRINLSVHTVLANRLIELGKKSTRVVAVSTGAVYDNNLPMPLDEDSNLAVKNSPYALSKVAMEKAMRSYADKGLDVVIVRPFNHIGPGQLGGFLIPDLVSQIAVGDTVVAGDLTTERDYTDVRDVVKAYALLATLPSLKHSLYNICSGKSVSGKAMLDEIVRIAGKQSVTVEIDQSRIRPNDPKKVVGDNSRLRRDTGWQPEIPLDQTIKDIITSQAPGHELPSA